MCDFFTNEKLTLLTSIVLGIGSMVLSYQLVLLQIKKTRKVKWVDDFKKEITEFIFYSTERSYHGKIEFIERINRSGITIRILLQGKKEPVYNDVVKKVWEIINNIQDPEYSLTNNTSYVDSTKKFLIGESLQDLYNLIDKIIKLNEE